MDYELNQTGKITVISLSGNLFTDEQTKDIMEQVNAKIDEDQNLFIIDLGEMKFINSSGLNLLLSILTKARKSGGDVILTKISDQLSKLLVITKLNAVFVITDDINSAVEKLENTANA